MKKEAKQVSLPLGMLKAALRRVTSPEQVVCEGCKRRAGVHYVTQTGKAFCSWCKELGAVPVEKHKQLELWP